MFQESKLREIKIIVRPCWSSGLQSYIFEARVGPTASQRHFHVKFIGVKVLSKQSGKWKNERMSEKN